MTYDAKDSINPASILFVAIKIEIATWLKQVTIRHQVLTLMLSQVPTELSLLCVMHQYLNPALVHIDGSTLLQPRQMKYFQPETPLVHLFHNFMCTNMICKVKFIIFTNPLYLQISSQRTMTMKLHSSY